MQQKLERTIRESPLFKHLDDAELEELIAHSSLETFQTRDKVIVENEPVHCLYIVLQGRVRVWTVGPKKDEIELKRLGPGAYFGEVSLMSGNKATATVQVIKGPAEFVSIDREHLLEFIEEDEKVRKMLQGVTLARAKDTIGKVFKQ